MRRLAILAVVLGLAACEKASAHIHCVTTAAPSVECDVKQTEGKSEVEVCWDSTVTCKNGTKITPPHSCVKVKDGGTAKVTIPADKLPNVASCDGEPKMVLTNQTIDGKPSTE